MSDAPERIWAWGNGRALVYCAIVKPSNRENTVEYIRADLHQAATMTLASFSDEQLLAELIRRNPPRPSAKSRTARDVECLVGIGKDHSVWIEFFHDDLDALRDITGEGEG
jgi:hypothetical protein